MVRWLYPLVALVLLSGAVHAQESPKELRGAWQDALLAGDADALADLYFWLATAYPVGQMEAAGSNEVRAVWASFFEANTVTGIVLQIAGEEEFGDTAAAWGVSTMTVAPKDGGEPFEMKARFTHVAKKIEGTWQYVTDHVSMPLTPPE